MTDPFLNYYGHDFSQDPFASPVSPPVAPIPQSPISSPSGGYDEMDEELKRKIAALQSQYDKDALASSAVPELSPTQAIAASVLKVAPMLLGMAIAKNRNVGISAGADAGLASGGAYEKRSYDDQQTLANRSALTAKQDLEQKRQLEGQQFQLQKQKQSDIATQNKTDDNQAFIASQNKLLESGRNSRFYEGEAGKDRRNPDANGGIDPKLAAIAERMGRGDPSVTPEERASVYGNKQLSSTAMRDRENLDVNTRSNKRLDYMNMLYDTKQAEKKIAGTSDMVDPSTGKPMTQSISAADKARVVVQTNNVIQKGADELIKSYQESGGRDLFWGDRALQDQWASLIWSANRQALQTGMRLEGKEQQLVNAMSPASYDLDGIMGVVKSFMAKEGPEGFAQTLKSVTEKATEARLQSFNKTLGGSAPTRSGPPQGAIGTRLAKDGFSYYVDAQGNALQKVQ